MQPPFIGATSVSKLICSVLQELHLKGMRHSSWSAKCVNEETPWGYLSWRTLWSNNTKCKHATNRCRCSIVQIHQIHQIKTKWKIGNFAPIAPNNIASLYLIVCSPKGGEEKSTWHRSGSTLHSLVMDMDWMCSTWGLCKGNIAMLEHHIKCWNKSFSSCKEPCGRVWIMKDVSDRLSPSLQSPIAEFLRFFHFVASVFLFFLMINIFDWAVDEQSVHWPSSQKTSIGPGPN